MPHIGLLVSEKLNVKVSVYQQNCSIQMKIDGLILVHLTASKNKKSEAVFLYFDNFSFISAVFVICHYIWQSSEIYS